MVENLWIDWRPLSDSSSAAQPAQSSILSVAAVFADQQRGPSLALLAGPDIPGHTVQANSEAVLIDPLDLGCRLSGIHHYRNYAYSVNKQADNHKHPFRACVAALAAFLHRLETG